MNEKEQEETRTMDVVAPSSLFSFLFLFLFCLNIIGHENVLTRTPVAPSSLISFILFTHAFSSCPWSISFDFFSFLFHRYFPRKCALTHMQTQTLAHTHTHTLASICREKKGRCGTSRSPARTAQSTGMCMCVCLCL